MTVAVGTCAVLLWSGIFVSRLAVLFQQGRDLRLFTALSSLRYRRPQDAESSAQRDELQQESSGKEPGHRRADSRQARNSKA